MRINPKNRTDLVIISTVALLFAACSSDDNHGMGPTAEMTAGNRELLSGINTARAGMQAYHNGDQTGGMQGMQEGRGNMQNGMGMMGVRCCIADAGAQDGGAQCSTMMNAGCCSKGGGKPDGGACMEGGMGMMMQGLADFDQGMGMMETGGNMEQAMQQMENAMKMMEQGAKQMMMGNGMGSMGKM